MADSQSKKGILYPELGKQIFIMHHFTSQQKNFLNSSINIHYIIEFQRVNMKIYPHISITIVTQEILPKPGSFACFTIGESNKIISVLPKRTRLRQGPVMTPAIRGYAKEKA